MKRRDFLKQCLGYTATIGTTILLGGINKLYPLQTSTQKNKRPDLVAIKGSEPEIMFDHGMKAFGGMKQFVKKGQTVVIKPNIGWDVEPELGANTNPKLVAQIVKHCYDAGAKKVMVFDHTCDYWKYSYKNSGIEEYAKQAKAQVVPAHLESYFQNVSIPNGIILKKAQVHEAILDADVFINVPVLKSHGSARLTMAMKNMMGTVWDRRYWHRNNLHQCIADFTTYRKPDLNIIDAYRVMMEHGPRGYSIDDISMLKTQIISTDIVAADTAATKVFGLEPDQIPYIAMAYDKKVGNMNLEQLNIERISL